VNPTKHALAATALSLTSATRADRWLGRFTRGIGMILCFHRVRPPANVAFAPNRALEVAPQFLDRTICTLLREGFEIIALDDVTERVRSHRLRSPFAVLTFDDGYRDNLIHAWPVLRRHGIPWTICVVPDFLSHAGLPWWIVLEQAVARLDRIRPSANDKTAVLMTGSPVEKAQAFAHLRRELQMSGEERRAAAIRDLAEQSEIDVVEVVRDACMDWDELAVLANDPDATIAAHTMSHPVLSRLCDTKAAREIGGSKRALEGRLNRAIRFLAYPHGDRGSVGTREFSIAQAAGYELGLTTKPSHVFPRHKDGGFSLPRISMNGLHQNEHWLRGLTSGIPFIFSWR
jgi:peptidoglycan/xylan/chitin deacetylase (PgdA/CDA1 family)